MAKMMGNFEAPATARNKEGGLSSEARVARCERLIASGMDPDDAAFRCGYKNKESFYARRNLLRRKANESGKESMSEGAPPDVEEEFPVPPKPQSGGEWKRTQPEPRAEAPAEEATANEPAQDGDTVTSLAGVRLQIGRVDGTFMQYERTEGGIRVVDHIGTLDMAHDTTVWRAVLREMDMALTMLGK